MCRALALGLSLALYIWALVQRPTTDASSDRVAIMHAFICFARDSWFIAAYLYTDNAASDPKCMGVVISTCTIYFLLYYHRPQISLILSICDILALLFATWVYEMRDYSEETVLLALGGIMSLVIVCVVGYRFALQRREETHNMMKQLDDYKVARRVGVSMPDSYANFAEYCDKKSAVPSVQTVLTSSTTSISNFKAQHDGTLQAVVHSALVSTENVPARGWLIIVSSPSVTSAMSSPRHHTSSLGYPYRLSQAVRAFNQVVEACSMSVSALKSRGHDAAVCQIWDHNVYIALSAVVPDMAVQFSRNLLLLIKQMLDNSDVDDDDDSISTTSRMLSLQSKDQHYAKIYMEETELSTVPMFDSPMVFAKISDESQYCPDDRVLDQWTITMKSSVCHDLPEPLIKSFVDITYTKITKKSLPNESESTKTQSLPNEVSPSPSPAPARRTANIYVDEEPIGYAVLTPAMTSSQYDNHAHPTLSRRMVVHDKLLFPPCDGFSWLLTFKKNNVMETQYRKMRMMLLIERDHEQSKRVLESRATGSLITIYAVSFIVLLLVLCNVGAFEMPAWFAGALLGGNVAIGLLTWHYRTYAKSWAITVVLLSMNVLMMHHKDPEFLHYFIAPGSMLALLCVPGGPILLIHVVYYLFAVLAIDLGMLLIFEIPAWDTIVMHVLVTTCVLLSVIAGVWCFEYDSRRRFALNLATKMSRKLLIHELVHPPTTSIISTRKASWTCPRSTNPDDKGWERALQIVPDIWMTTYIKQGPGRSYRLDDLSVVEVLFKTNVPHTAAIVNALLVCVLRQVVGPHAFIMPTLHRVIVIYGLSESKHKEQALSLVDALPSINNTLSDALRLVPRRLFYTTGSRARSTSRLMNAAPPPYDPTSQSLSIAIASGPALHCVVGIPPRFIIFGDVLTEVHNIAMACDVGHVAISGSVMVDVESDVVSRMNKGSLDGREVYTMEIQ